ncbi:MAG: hypothetical protein MUC38_11990 [Cyclobacteriaceae bacterium]|nr:hypothetical protein [Cyclobacteriaceae bacterium]
MKSFLVTAGLLLSVAAASAQEYKVITTVESIVPGGLGRSRMTEAKENGDYKPLTTSRVKGTKSEQGDVKRDDVKIDAFDETKLLNFYSIVGINFQNIASNDAVVTSKLNEMAKEGWTLIFVTSGVESDAGKSDGDGIFITRYIFKR